LELSGDGLDLVVEPKQATVDASQVRGRIGKDGLYR